MASTFEHITPSVFSNNISLSVAFISAYFLLIGNYADYSLVVGLTLMFNFIFQVNLIILKALNYF